MLVIPAIDILNGKVVRLSKGDYSQSKIYSDSVEAQADKFYEAGFKRIHIVDLGGSRDGKINIKKMLKIIKQKFPITIQFGGGVRSNDDIEELINLGVDKIIVGSFSVNNKAELEESIKKYGANKFIIAADVRNKLIAIKGWTETSSIAIEEHIKFYKKLGVKSYLCTDIEKDGLLKGPSFDLYKDILATIPGIDLIGSGGITLISDIYNLEKIGIKKVIVGKAIYENKIALKELKDFA